MADIKISQLPDGAALGGLEEVPIVQGGETVKVLAQDFMDFISGGMIGLDTVLANGNVSTRTIKLQLGGSIEVDGYVKTNNFRLLNGSFYGDLTAPTGGFTANRTIKLPNVSQTLVATINGIAADANGNVVITSLAPTAHTHPISDIIGLETELDLKISFADGDARYYPLSSNPEGYVTASSTATFTNKSGNISQWTNDSNYITTAGARTAISLTTTGSSGAATYNNSTGVLNVPTYNQTLQQVLTAGATTTVAGIILTNDSGYINIIEATGQGAAGIQVNSGGELALNNSFGNGGILRVDYATIPNANWQLPDGGGTLVKSVNGVSPNASGDVVVSGSGVTSISGTTNRISITGTTTPSIDISSSYVGQTSITTLGTIGTGTWQGTAIADTYISSASTWNAKQAALSGTGFVKISGTTISYDNSTYLTQTAADALYSALGHTHTFASLTSKPTTIAGYGIADAFTQGTADTLYSAIGHTHAFSDLTSKPTTLSGYGITDAIAKSTGAYKFHANNTNATADVTEQIFKDIAEQTYSGSITWTGTTAPSGTTDFRYSWTQVGNLVTYDIALVYGTAGTSVTAIQVELPSDMPDPKVKTGLGGASSMLYRVIGSITTSNTITTTGSVGMLRRNSGNTANEIYLATSSGNYKVVMAQGHYHTA